MTKRSTPRFAGGLLAATAALSLSATAIAQEAEATAQAEAMAQENNSDSDAPRGTVEEEEEIVASKIVNGIQAPDGLLPWQISMFSPAFGHYCWWLDN